MVPQTNPPYKSKVLLFKNILKVQNKESEHAVSLATFYLGSSIKNAGHDVILSDLKLSSPTDSWMIEQEKLDRILFENPDINIIGISLYESLFKEALDLIKFLKKRTRAFIGVGGIMPTLSPWHVIAHIPDINFLIRGDSEEIFPLVAQALANKFRDSFLGSDTIALLNKGKGLFFKNNESTFYFSLSRINSIKESRNFFLNFSLLGKDELKDGLFLFTSRGCLNNCFFCTTPGRGEYLARDFSFIKNSIELYLKKLVDIYGINIPSNLLKVAFNDDDFLTDSWRAKKVFNYFRKHYVKINFFQTGINSFFKKNGVKTSDCFNMDMINHLSPSLFFEKDKHIFIGTENFCDQELKRLGKGYSIKKIEKVIHELSSRKIFQYHHLILCNQMTSLENLFENLFKIAVFQKKYGVFFRILTPVIPYLVSLFPSKSYKIIKFYRREKFLKIKDLLKKKKEKSLDYPLVEYDIPINNLIREMIPFLENRFSLCCDYAKIFDDVLCYLLFLNAKRKKKSFEAKRVFEKFLYYPIPLSKNIRQAYINNRGNLQIMMTRRCHLRCSYCPVLKGEDDTNKKVIYKTIQLLFKQPQKYLRLDFTGGEPLLRFDLIVKAVKFARKLSAKNKKNISFYMVTNLIALDEKKADFLKKENFFLELSCDGMKKCHNKYKISTFPHIDPYEATISKLKYIFSKKINYCVIMVAAPQTCGLLYENFCHLLRLGFRNIGINYALCDYWNQKDKNIFLNQLNLIKIKFGSYLKKNLISLFNFQTREEPTILNSEIMVDTDGSLHLSTDWLFGKKKSKFLPALGNILTARNFNHIFMTKFHILKRLLDHHKDSTTRKIIINNIEMGNCVQNFLNQWKNI